MVYWDFGLVLGSEFLVSVVMSELFLCTGIYYYIGLILYRSLFFFYFLVI